jgi:hypothetical protein
MKNCKYHGISTVLVAKKRTIVGVGKINMHIGILDV